MDYTQPVLENHYGGTFKSCTDPWLIMRDFNYVLNPEDKLVGSQIQLGEMKDFRECVDQCSLTEIPTVGREYT